MLKMVYYLRKRTDFLGLRSNTKTSGKFVILFLDFMKEIKLKFRKHSNLLLTELHEFNLAFAQLYLVFSLVSS